MQAITCIVCPNGCTLCIDALPTGDYTVSGQQCKRGERFAIEELTAPKRMLCSTVRTMYARAPVIPVRVSAEIPKEKLFAVMSELSKVIISSPVHRGEAIIHNVLELGVDVIATSNILCETIDGGKQNEQAI